ncbi:Hypothetical protein Tpal_2044 [Trichococcus palustris]|uniref:Thoeris protein ThsB TIR-like domain-containing protein n=1 Tax=Trichococcus palustris TaxID=140314 RepID=A0A143YT14_9LACT|nr:toll/interleukin-1 receptor domain-containing protein [Trichococcus palustris]CZQ96725.1 Hypothetical protein Tpal_2044 [Trichococcus palustris]SFK74304.1 TIR domain-containing protein [Trichococcus palustris]
MSGKTKRKYDHESMLIAKSITQSLKKISEILPQYYTKQDLINEYKKYYPFDWQRLVERQQNYQEKDVFLISKRIKKRYYAKTADEFFFSLPKVKHMLSEGMRIKYSNNFEIELVLTKIKELESKRTIANEKITSRIRESKLNAQNVTPSYLDYYIKDYHKKGITTEEKLIIATELAKFDTDEVTIFFRKLNDSEKNDMIRRLSYDHLIDFGHYAKLRKGFKGKKKNYQTERVSLEDVRPQDLYTRLQSHAVNSKQRYDYFISHSSMDKKRVRDITNELNLKGNLCYCDWSIDDIFLKREYVSEYTKEVLKVRMEQSNKLLFIRTKNSMKSDWVEFELKYFEQLGKPIYEINHLENTKSLYSQFDIEKVKRKVR